MLDKKLFENLRLKKLFENLNFKKRFKKVDFKKQFERINLRKQFESINFKEIIERIDFKKLFLGSLSIFLVALSLIVIVLHLYLLHILPLSEKTHALFEPVKAVFYTVTALSVVVCAWFVSKEIRLAYLYKITSLYVLYLMGSYFLTTTLNLNNGAFRFSNYSQNGFYQFNFFFPLLLILSLGYGLQYYTKWLRQKMNKPTPVIGKSSVTLHGLMAAVLLTDDWSLQVIDRLYGEYFRSDLVELCLQLALYITLLLILYGLLSFFLIRGFEAIRTNQPNLALAVSSSFFFGLIFNYTLQLGLQKNEALMKMYIFPAATAYQIILIFLLSLTVYLLVNRYLSATCLIIGFWSIISIINSIKMDMRNEPLLLTDFNWIKQIGLVMDFVDNTWIINISLIAVVILLTYLALRKRLLPGKIVSRWSVRLTSLLALYLFLLSGFTVFQKEKNRVIQDGIPILSQLNNNYNAFWLDLSYHARYRSLLFVWTKQLTANTIEKPSDYSRERMEQLEQKYKEIAEEINKSRTGNLNEQTVIFVLSESFADPNRLSGISISQDILPNIKKIMGDHTSGTMISDGYGGGTANMEWQSLVGLPMYNMSESISTINTEVVPKMPFIPSISDSFDPENRIAIHLGDASTYLRNRFYLDKLGFSSFIAVKNGTTNVKDYYRLGFFPSDQSTYENVLKAINSGEKQFLSVITYQNHIPYSHGDPSELVATGQAFSEDENISLTSFARLIYQTDTETQHFLNQLSHLKEKVTVVFYGDHLPGFYPASQFEEKPNSQYETDYFIWSNYQQVKLDFPSVSSSDFPATLLAHTNSKVSPYYALLTKVLEKASINESDSSKEQEEIREDLLLVEYDLIDGSGYLKQTSEFFEIMK